MSKLFNFAQLKGKWHKFLSFNLGGGAKLYKNFAQKLLAVSLCMAVVLMGVPLGGHGVHVVEAAAEPTRTKTPITVPEANLDANGTDITKWKKNGDVYETQNQGDNENACTMEVPVEVTAGYAELEFEWKVSSQVGYDFLWFELKDAGTGDVLQSNQKSGEETAFDKVVLKLDKGTYTLTFTYQGDGGEVSATIRDTGYVKNLNLVTYSGVSAISKMMFAEPTDLVASNNFSLATADYSKVGKISFGTRPGEVKYYKNDLKTPYSVGSAGTPTPITWLIAGSDATDGLVLYSEAPLVGCDNLNGTTNTSVFQVDSTNWTYNAPAGSGYGDADSVQVVYANHWGESNLRAQLTALASNSSYFNSAEQGLMATSTVSTIDTSSAVTYTTTDLLYAPRLIATDYRYLTNTSVTVGGAPSLAIDMAHWGAVSWLRSPYLSPYLDDSLFALVALPGAAVGRHRVFFVGPSVSAAFRLNLSSVIFTSAASAASSAEGGNFSKISADTPMTLRLDGTVSDKPLNGINTPKVEAGVITYTAPTAGARLMVLATGSDGATYQYFKDVTGPGSLALSGITSSLPAGMTYTARAWLETDVGDGGTLTYATKATDEFAFCTGCTLKEVPSTATCTEPGYAAHYKCSMCGQLFSDADGNSPIAKPTEIPATGHDWGDWVTDPAPTCTAPGTKTRTCEHDSSHTETEAIPATGHNSSGDWQKDETHHWKVCGTCSDKIDTAEHTWDGGTVTTQPTTSAPGVKTYKCSVCGQTKTETIPKLDQENTPGGGDDLQDFRPDGTTDPATWGSAVTRGDIPHWVAADGTTSVQVPADNGILWLREESDGTSAWYGLDNSAGVFAEGSRFWVRWLSKQSDPTLWQYYYDKFDTEHKTDVESDNLWIFLIGVTAPDGTEYTDFDTEVPLYIQKGPDWDGNDIRSVFISGASDEVLLSHFHGTMDYPESALHPAAEFYKIMLSHFSPYAIFDELTDEEKAALGLPSTGDISTELLISGLAIVLVSSLGVMLRLITNKKKFEE